MVTEGIALLKKLRKLKLTEDALAFMLAFCVVGFLIGYIKINFSTIFSGIAFNILLLVFLVALLATILIKRWLNIPFLNIQDFPRVVLSIPFILLLVWIAQLLANKFIIKNHDFSAILWAFTIGFIFRNIIGLPQWLKPAVRTSLYTKSGMILMGSGVVVSNMWKVGILSGILLAFGAYVLWHICWLLKDKLKIDDDTAALMYGSISFSNMPGNNVIDNAIKADPVLVDHITSLVFVFTIPLMIVQTSIVQWSGIPDVLAGVWLGSTLETTGALAASNVFISSMALNTVIIIKIVQGFILSITAYIYSVLWALKKTRMGRSGKTPKLVDIWMRYPKYLMGILFVSILFSTTREIAIVNTIPNVLFCNITWWFALVFLCMGFDSNLRSLFVLGGFRAFILFVIAQFVNLGWLLLLMYVLFAGY